AISLLFLFLTVGLLMKDLDRPARFAYVLLRPQWRSWLVRGGYALLIYGALLSAWAVSRFLEWQNAEAWSFFGSAVFAVIGATYTAFLFAQAKGRDFWQSPILLLHMLAHAFVAGAAILMLQGLFLKTSEEWNLIFLISMVFNLMILGAEVIMPHPTEDAKRTVWLITSGLFRRQFWFGALLLGNLLPLALVWLGTPTSLAAASILALIGIYTTESIWVHAPQRIPLS
ncbi:MAG TPA: NrfD/PsrC family molybdoenzyme membrane anchor subunit, partial [Acidobacteriota bacterium]|nr:NrfD/PsrC family molybdoenzyme membrane anchor subunit [Acidobacteriota bacterium]